MSQKMGKKVEKIVFGTRLFHKSGRAQLISKTSYLFYVS